MLGYMYVYVSLPLGYRAKKYGRRVVPQYCAALCRAAAEPYLREPSLLLWLSLLLLLQRLPLNLHLLSHNLVGFKVL